VTSAKAATVGAALAKGGTAKGIATVGTLSGVFAMLGGTYISLRAQADDSKSPRERKFMLQWYGKRMFLTLLVFAPFFAAQKCSYFQTRLHLDYLGALFLYVVCAYGMAGFAYHTRRQQQIQIEDNTFVAAEWILPRTVTEVAANAVDPKPKDRFKGRSLWPWSLAWACWF